MMTEYQLSSHCMRDLANLLLARLPPRKEIGCERRSEPASAESCGNCSRKLGGSRFFGSCLDWRSPMVPCSVVVFPAALHLDGDIDLGFDSHVLFFTLSMALLTAVFIGSHARRSRPRTKPMEVLKVGGRGGTVAGREARSAAFWS